MKFLKEYKLLTLSIVFSILLITVDQFTKVLALNNIDELVQKTNGVHNHFKVLPFLNVVLIFNKGISFGVFNNSSFIPIILVFIISMIIIYISYLLYRSKDFFSSLYLSMILGGAVGNIIDRFKYGAVVDFIDFYIEGWHFPAFNFADAIISIGVMLILVEELFLKNDNKTLLLRAK